MATDLKPLENAMKSHLRSLGYFNIEIQDDNKDDRSFNVIADGTLRQMFILVLILLANETNKSLSKEKIKHIKSEAKKQEKEAWTAIMKVDETGKLIEDIKWTNLSKLTA